MSRIGKKPVSLPSGVTALLQNTLLVITGPLGKIERAMVPEVRVKIDGSSIVLERSARSLRHNQMYGLMRTLIANMVEGVTKGFTKMLEMKGVGYRAQVSGKDLELSAGFSHPISIKAPHGISFKVEENVRITVSGIEKDLVGKIAAEIRRIRKPEPYKGKGIYYIINGQPEKIIRKEGKRAATSTT